MDRKKVLLRLLGALLDASWRPIATPRIESTHSGEGNLAGFGPWGGGTRRGGTGKQAGPIGRGTAKGQHGKQEGDKWTRRLLDRGQEIVGLDC